MPRKAWGVILAGVGSVLLAAHLLAAAAAESPQAGERQYIVSFVSSYGESTQRKLCESHGGRVRRTLRIINSLVVRVDGQRSDKMMDDLRKNPLVARVEEDRRIKWIEEGPASVVEVKLPSVRTILESGRAGRLGSPSSRIVPAEEPPEGPGTTAYPWGIQRVKAPQAWARARGAGVKVAIIDTGIDLEHSALKPNIAGNYNAQDPSKSGNDDNGHGTHVAGTVAAVFKEKGVVGVAPEAKLYAVKVLDADGFGDYSDVIAGIDWTVQNGMQLANMSLGADAGSDSLREAVEKASSAGVTLVAAAGNSGGAVSFPGAYPQVLAVSALDESDQVTGWSSRGPEVDFIAPGNNIQSTYIGGVYLFLSGTSMAAPHVTGLAALAISLGAQGPGGVLNALRQAAISLPGLKPEEQGAGLVDAERIGVLGD